MIWKLPKENQEYQLQIVTRIPEAEESLTVAGGASGRLNLESNPNVWCLERKRAFEMTTHRYQVFR